MKVGRKTSLRLFSREAGIAFYSVSFRRMMTLLSHFLFHGEEKRPLNTIVYIQGNLRRRRHGFRPFIQKTKLLFRLSLLDCKWHISFFRPPRSWIKLPRRRKNFGRCPNDAFWVLFFERKKGLKKKGVKKEYVLKKDPIFCRKVS